MISSLLLPLAFATVPTPGAAAATDDPPIRLWIDERQFFSGDRAKVQVRTEYDGYLLVLHVDPEGRLRILFPIDPDKDNFVRGGRKYEVRGRGGREAFEAHARGRGSVYAAVSRDPLRFDGYVTGDHWDYRSLAPSRLGDDPEPELNELVQRMAQSSFDYDIMTYDVVDRSSYASRSYYYPRYYGSLYDDPWCYRLSCGRYYSHSPYSLSIGLYFGRPYRRYYYDPYYYAYDPFYNPFFFDPYYYAPVYYPRYVYPRRHFYGYYDRYHHWDRGRFATHPHRYRFRVADGLTPYRDRRHDLRRSINTVYNPPVSRLREPATANPARRVFESPTAELPNRVAPRRVLDNQRRPAGKIEARRSRPRDDQPRAQGSPEVRGGERTNAGARPAPRREVERPRHNERSEPRLERRREESPTAERGRVQPRAVERRREEPRRVERAPAPRQAPAPGRASRSEGRSSGGTQANGGGRRRN